MISTCGGSSGPLALLDAAAFDVFFTTLPEPMRDATMSGLR
jgi:hypothetical protein